MTVLLITRWPCLPRGSANSPLPLQTGHLIRIRLYQGLYAFVYAPFRVRLGLEYVFPLPALGQNAEV
jgi:hypothetical protein